MHSFSVRSLALLRIIIKEESHLDYSQILIFSEQIMYEHFQIGFQSQLAFTKIKRGRLSQLTRIKKRDNQFFQNIDSPSECCEPNIFIVRMLIDLSLMYIYKPLVIHIPGSSQHSLPFNNIILRMSNSSQAIKTIKCPFDPSHVMPYERFLNHLEKCQYPDKKSYRKCKFNPYHVLHMGQINSHENNCPDKKKYEQVDDDWGVSDEPVQVKVQMKQEKSEISYSTSFSDSKSSNSFVSFNSSLVSEKPKKIYKPVGKKSNDSSNKVINNSLFKAEDLESFNPIQQ